MPRERKWLTLLFYTVDEWTIEDGVFVAGTGAEGSLTAQVKITANTTVRVSFIRYKKVAINKLDNYLQTASSTDINYIEVTGLTAADLKGKNDGSGPWMPSRLGSILQSNREKKVALKLSAVSGLTDMSYCFLQCTSLMFVELKCDYNSAFECMFYGCTSLTPGSIKVPSGQLDAYKAGASNMEAQENWFTE